MIKNEEITHLKIALKKYIKYYLDKKIKELKEKNEQYIIQVLARNLEAI